MSARRLTLRLLAPLCVLTGLVMVCCAPAALAVAPEAPGAVTVESVTASTAMIRGVLNPGGAGEEGTYEFLYRASGTECEGGSKAPASPGLSFGIQGEEVVESLSGLQAHTEYSVCLLARNQAGETALSAPVTFTTLVKAPAVEEESITDVAASSATFHATVNPGGADTTYRFEDATNGGGYEPVRGSEGEPLTGAQGDAGAGSAGVPVEVHVQNLTPKTSYRFRLQASNSLETVNGLDQSFATQAVGGFALPDGRQWEMVSQPQKQGALIEPISETGVIQASTTGDAVSYLADTPTEPEPLGFTNRTQVLSTRGPDGWSSVDLAPPHKAATGKSVGAGQEYRFFSEDLSLGVVQPFGSFMPLSDDASEQTAYLHNDFSRGNVDHTCAEGCYRPLATGCPAVGQSCASSVEEAANVPPGTVFGGGNVGKCALICGPSFVGATPDLSHVVIQSNVSLTLGASVIYGAMYEWFGGRLTFIGEGRFDAISDDGALVFFEAEGGTNQLFVHDVPTGETVSLDSPEEFGAFLTASADGSKAFFKDEGNLRECEVTVAAGKLACNVSDLAGGVVGVLGMNKDGSWLYFASHSVLTNVPNRDGEQAVNGSCEGTISNEGVCNLYTMRRGEAGWEAPRLVAELSGRDIPDWSGEMQRHTAHVSSDGEWLAFMSQKGRASYDNRDTVSGHPDEEVYLYNSSSETLSCASCNPTGAQPEGVEYNKLEGGLVSGDRVWNPSDWLAANIPGWTPYRLAKALYQSHYLSGDGRLFFNSSDALVPQDGNGAEDVYEYEPPGVGGCDSSSVTFSERSGGCVDLVSSGTSGEESGFLDASDSGGDVFFLTAAKLASQDFDTALDVYDAHQCTLASPCLPSPVLSPPLCVTGDACKPAPTPQPASFGAPSSATFSGAGNVLPSTGISAVKPKTLTRAQKLAQALRECRTKKNHKKRAACERQARKRYTAKAAGKSNAKKRGK
ncbi:MAG: hypothetical protein WAN93_14575 [Solirubrobacteraceae bacterium]